MIALSVRLSAQEEAVIAVRDRLDKSNSFSFAMGQATSLGQNNYKSGALLGLVYQKRLNRILSAGIGLSYSTYRVDYKEYMTGKYFDPEWNNEQPTNFYYTSSQAQYYLVNLSGGDLGLASAQALLKINFVPIKSGTVASAYASIAPGVVMASLTQVQSNINFFEHPDDFTYSQANNTSFESAAAQSTWTGCLVLSFGVEFFPVNQFSFFMQADFGYHLALPFVDTSLYQERVLEEPYYNPYEDYPMPANFPLSDNTAFLTLNFRLGLSYNF